ncbi:MAG: DUF4101 domain-containing protein [Pegethrix bostrychoides GSE-TBD4-15B]|uniref:DUF4101 domain-containing protein n=1 Tax=Pegethrix bostrychoides GSE-TBD4-15B TaxID=2839662 RepID=A0A951PCE0_9CYAN|nr:DUF4101 domain-containing protein [Pegethrix bostrychoides GSE-TBD4-15B]
MRIPLDYYRVLGLPIQATAEQLQQAHRDRTQQLPRREFSEAAILARRALIDQAYGLLSDPSQRQDYDASFLAKSYDLSDAEAENFSEDLGYRSTEGSDSYSPSIELEEPQLVGALLILLELGEYELVLRLGRPYLNNGSPELKSGRFGEPEIVLADVVLTVALAHLELGREQWQQGQYENAASSLESGQELLLREGLYANIRGEMQSDLFKLRPYRILELILLPDGQEEQRRHGIGLLEDMLHDRGGIDGNGDDSSGLSVDDFLRFIQQLRSYLTSAEQQVLFEAEARRPSAVATYLAVYALLARGFAQRQPALIRRAKLLLLRLGGYQDVHLEQAVCSLLLGQTEEASRALELSQEFESLAFIREHSQTSPDLLPGLCLYSERWFQNEVFPHFRDLQQRQVSLTDYFADEDVQIYLEELPAEPEAAPAFPKTARAATRAASRPDVQAAPAPRLESRELSRAATERSYAVGAGQANSQANGQGNLAGTVTLDPRLSARTADPTGMPPADGGSLPPENGQRLSGQAVGNPPAHRSAEPAERDAHHLPEAQRQAVPRSPVRRPSIPSNLRLDRILLLAALGLLGVMLLGFLFGKLLNRPTPAPSADTGGSSGSSGAAGSGTELGNRAIEPAFSEFANRQLQGVSVSSAITEANAPEVVQAWLEAKAAALGENHEIDRLDQILVEPLLSVQRTRAEDLKAENSYLKLSHSQVEIVSVESSQDIASSGSASDSPDSDSLGVDLSSPEADSETATGDDAENPTSGEAAQASIEAVVSEKADFYNAGELDSNASYDSTVRVRYELVQQDSQWRIQSMNVLE